MACIGLDFDGVVTNCGRLKALGAKKLFNVDIPEEDFKKEIVIGKGFLTPEQYKEVQVYVYGDMEMGLYMEEVPDALQSIRELQKEHQIIIVTSRTKQFADVAQEWLRLRNFHLEIREVDYEKTKKDDTSGFDVFVDDDIEKLTDLIGHVPHLFLFDWSYNKEHILPQGIQRVFSWNDLVVKITTELSH